MRAKTTKPPPKDGRDDRRPYPISLAKCTECEWVKTVPRVRLSDLRKAAKKHTDETDHTVWIDSTPGGA